MKNLLSTVAIAAVMAFAAAPAFAQNFVGTVNASVVEDFDNVDTLGAALLWDRDSALDFEATVDFTVNDKLADEQLVGVNAVYTPEFKVLGVQPYALAGLGYAFGAEEATWTVGAGGRYDLTDRLGLDARYRRVEGFDSGVAVDIGTLGVSYRF